MRNKPDAVSDSAKVAARDAEFMAGRLTHKSATDMLTAAEARARVLACVSPRAAEDIPLSEALGRVLAASVVARRDHPPFAASAMDGYAVRSSDTPGSLKIVGEVAGRRPR
jgi:molybdopterin biosynthesis enzyme